MPTATVRTLTSFQAEGEPHQLWANTVRKDPQSSVRLLQRIRVGAFQNAMFPRVLNIISGVRIQNEVSSWDCQEYVIDIMDALEAERILGAMPKYAAVKRAIKGMRGDIESTRRAVIRYDYAQLREQPDEEDASSEGSSGDDGNDQPRNIRSAETVQDSSEED